MGRVVDIHNRLVPCIWFFEDFWATQGVTTRHAASVFNLASGALTPTPEALAAFRDSVRGWSPEQREVLRAFGPDRVMADLTLAGRPGLLLVERGGFRNPMVGAPAPARLVEAEARVAEHNFQGTLSITNTIVLFAGQVLRGISAVELGSHMDFAGGPSPAIRVANSGLDAGTGCRIEGLRLTTIGRRVGVEVNCPRTALVRVRLFGFTTAVRFTNAPSSTLRWCEIQGEGPLVVVEESSEDCALVGCELRAARTAVRLAGHHGSLLRSRLARVAGKSQTLWTSPPLDPLVEVAADGCALMGNRLSAEQGGHLVRIDEDREGTLLDKNVYVDDDAKARTTAPILDDQGRQTLLRDATHTAFPSASLSTRNLLLNSTFGTWEGLAPELPAHWALEPDQAAWTPVADPRSRGAGQPWPPAAQARQGRFFGRGREPTRLFGSFPLEAPGDFSGAYTTDELFNHTPDIHLERHALWMGVTADATRAAMAQRVPVPSVAREFVLSAFVKARGPGQATLEVGRSPAGGGQGEDSVPALSWSEVQGSEPGEGGWRQLTLNIRLHTDLRGELALDVRCVIVGAAGGPTEAFFDRLMLVAGSIVPHHAPYQAVDAGGRMEATRVRTGRWFQQVFQPKPGEVRSAFVVATEVEELEDLWVSFRATDALSLRGQVALDLLRNGKSMLRQPVQGLKHLQARGEHRVGRIPASGLHGGGLRPGDLITLVVPTRLEELRVVLSGRVRWI